MRKYIIPELNRIVFDSKDIITASNAGETDKLFPEGGEIEICGIDESTIWSDN